MTLNQSKLNALLASIVILGVCITPGISQAEEPPIGEVTTKAPATSAEDSATAWDKTREGSVEAWDKTKEVSGDAWDATKEGSAKAWDKTKEVSADVWDATREGSAEAWDKTKTTVQGWQETEPESETDSNQETPAPSQSP
jgi:hypothetical protein